MTSNAGCNIRFGRTVHGGAIDRIIPAPDDEGIVAVWQVADSIKLQRHDRECNQVGDEVEVVRDEKFFALPGENGLSEAVGMSGTGGATVVAWILDGSVWVRVIPSCTESSTIGCEPSQMVRANNATEGSQRTDVRIVMAKEDNAGFVVAWSSWEQDGDGWGIYAAFFSSDGTPVGRERQLNSAWKRFQWRAELTWCGDFIYAMWMNGTGAPCGIPNPDKDCANGPMVRAIASPVGTGKGIEDQTNQIPEVDLGGSQPIEATLGCMSDDRAVALWLQGGGSEVRWEFRQGQSKETMAASSSTAAGSIPRSLSQLLEQSWSYPFATTSWASVRRLVERGFLQAASVVPRRWVAGGDGGAHGFDLGSSLLSGGSSFGEVEGAVSAASSLDGHSAVLTTSGVMVLMKNSANGDLSVQLLDYASEWGPVAYPPHVAATGISHARAVWDHPPTGPPALTVCALMGGGVGGESAPEYVCLYRGVLWVAYANGLGLGMPLTIQMAIYAILIVCCLGIHCVARAAFSLEMQRHGTRPLRQRRQVREFMAQLAEIPAEPPASASSPPAEEGECPSTQCAICDATIEVRVAFRPCGHTACRECTARLVDTEPKCPQCSATITGLQPVYL